MSRFFERCWEHMRCNEHTTCSAFPDKGEICWEVAGTMRNNEAEKRLEWQCKLARESGRELTEQDLMMFEPVAPVKLCKYIERYNLCRCCPYYKYVEFKKKSTQTKKYVDPF